MKTAPSNTARHRGFTMIEVLLAIGIFSMVMAAIYASWSAIMRGTRSGLGAAAEVQRTRVAIRALEESLGSAVMFTDNPIYYSFLAATSGDFAALSFVARLPESFPGSGLFEGYPLRRVEFSVDEQQNLVLKQMTVLDASVALDPGAQPYTIVLAPKVGLFAIEFFDGRLNEWVPEWISTNTLPRMVRVAMGFGEKQQYTSQSSEMTLRMIPLNATPITRGGAGSPLPGGMQQMPPGGQPGGQNPRDRGGRSDRRGGMDRRGGGMGDGFQPPPGQFGGGAGMGDPLRFQPRLPPGFNPGASANPVRNPVFPPTPGR